MLVKIELYHDGEAWCARGIGEDIYTQGTTLEEAFDNIKEAVAVHFEPIKEPVSILILTEVQLGSAATPPG